MSLTRQSGTQLLPRTKHVRLWNLKAAAGLEANAVRLVSTAMLKWHEPISTFLYCSIDDVTRSLADFTNE